MSADRQAGLRRGTIEALQNDVRRAINVSGTPREGAGEADLKRLILLTVDRRHRPNISLRRRGRGTTAPAEYALRYQGELLFRLVFVEWGETYPHAFGRWHVRRHPEATWWRQS